MCEYVSWESIALMIFTAHIENYNSLNQLSLLSQTAQNLSSKSHYMEVAMIAK